MKLTPHLKNAIDALRHSRRLQLILALMISLALYVGLPEVIDAMRGSLYEHVLLILATALAMALIESVWLRRESIHQAAVALGEVLSGKSSFLSEAQTIGLTGIFATRKAAMQLARSDMERATERIWLLGVALAEDLQLDKDIVELLHSKISAGLDVRILLLDPYRSPSVFRSFLESPSAHVKEILDATEKGNGNLAVGALFLQLLYRRFQTTFNEIDGDLLLRPHVKFYRHSPNLWAIVADDVAYVEQYTFGGSDNKEIKCIGSLMPVLRYENTRAPDRRDPFRCAFRVIADHVEKLWITSDTDVFHMRACVDDKERIALQVLRTRLPWLQEVQWALDANRKNPDLLKRRASTRQLCSGSPDALCVRWKSEGAHIERKARIVDTSESGMAIEINSKTHPELLPQRGAIVELVNALPAANLAAEYVISDLERRGDRKYVVSNWREGRPNHIVLGLCIGSLS